MNLTDIYPIAETFHSLQGEGVWTGTPMHFIRLAGCNVGRADLVTPRALQDAHATDAHTICTSWCGEKFVCDTNYRRSDHRTVELLVEATWEKHVCLTGGEPFIHDLVPLMQELIARDINVHVETSGTKLIPEFCSHEGIWITCSPKEGFLPENYPIVDEWKFVVGPKTEPSKITRFLEGAKGQPVFLQPINKVDKVELSAMNRVLSILQSGHPDWRVSVQLHKLLGMR